MSEWWKSPKSERAPLKTNRLQTQQREAKQSFTNAHTAKSARGAHSIATTHDDELLLQCGDETISFSLGPQPTKLHLSQALHCLNRVHRLL
eukprot:8775910-Pyramimonas_sp.AAC.1